MTSMPGYGQPDRLPPPDYCYRKANACFDIVSRLAGDADVAAASVFAAASASAAGAWIAAATAPRTHRLADGHTIRLDQVLMVSPASSWGDLAGGGVAAYLTFAGVPDSRRVDFASQADFDLFYDEWTAYAPCAPEPDGGGDDVSGRR